MVFVVKADGRKEEFVKKKILRTCLRSGASRAISNQIADKIESQVRDGWTTHRIYRTIIKELDKEGVIARIPESEAGQKKSSRPMKQYQLTPFGILVSERLENARRDFAKAFIMKGKGKHHPPPPLFKGLTKEELSEALNEADLEALKDFQKHLEHRIRHDQRILKEVEKEIKVKKG